MEAVQVDSRVSAVNVELLVAGGTKLPSVLSRMGYTALREGQDATISNILSGRDTICILPTGTGKSACFIIPTLCHDWKTLVVSPLVALMRDQVKSLWRMGISAGAISSVQTQAENNSVIQAWSRGELQFMYVAPERLDNAQFQQALNAAKPDHVVVDEAHCLSQWSDSFRPSYMKVGELITDRNPLVVSAFTATCPKEVEGDIRRILGIPNAELCRYYPRRKNLLLSSCEYPGPSGLAQMIDKVKGSVIVYCSTVKEVENLAGQLSRLIQDEVVPFHGRMTPDEKRTNQDLFMDGHAKVVVSTNAFGMGIDKADIRAVFHRDMPGNLEQLSQEIGRAGRDGLDSICVTMKDDKSLSTQQFFVEAANPGRADIKRVYDALKSRADGRQNVYLTGVELSRVSGVRDYHVTSALSILAGAEVIKRFAADSRIAKVKLLATGFEDKRFIKAVGLIKEGGVADDAGFLEIDLSWLTTMWGVTEQTVTRNLKQWDQERYLSYLPPFNGKVTQIIGPIELVDFDRLNIKARDDYNSLKKVIDYFSVPDDQKHEFLEAYFQRSYE
jgi:ATP-dependent DNA helicase RecQ